MKTIYLSLALVAAFAAAPASAQFSGFYEAKVGGGSFANTPSPIAAIGAGEGAEINRHRAMAGAEQYRPVKICATDVNIGTYDGARRRLTSRRDSPYVGNLQVFSGGYCPIRNRRGQ